LLSGRVRTKDTFKEKISHKAKGTQESYQTLLNKWEEFSLEKFDSEDLIAELKLVEEDTLWDTLQQWINWNHAKGQMPQVNKFRFSLLKKYLHHRGIKIFKEDIEENLDFPTVTEEEPYSLPLEEAQLIIKNAPFKKQVMYLCMLSSGMRIGETCQLKPKHLNLDKKRIMVKIPSSIAKYNRSRTTFFSEEASKILKTLLKKLDDDDLIFGTHKNPKYAETNEIQQLKRLLISIGLYEKQENGHGKITSHSFRAYFITKVSRFDRDLAHYLAGQKNKMYLPRYDRLTDDDKLELYMKIEPDLLIDDSVKKQSEIELMKEKILSQAQLKEQIKTELREEAKEKKEYLKGQQAQIDNKK
jgi:integrase